MLFCIHWPLLLYNNQVNKIQGFQFVSAVFQLWPARSTIRWKLEEVLLEQAKQDQGQKG